MAIASSTQEAVGAEHLKVNNISRWDVHCGIGQRHYKWPRTERIIGFLDVYRGDRPTVKIEMPRPQ